MIPHNTSLLTIPFAYKFIDLLEDLNRCDFTIVDYQKFDDGVWLFQYYQNPKTKVLENIQYYTTLPEKLFFTEMYKMFQKLSKYLKTYDN